MLYASIDLHKRSAHIIVTDRDEQKVGDKNMACDPMVIREFLSQYAKPLEAVIEATTNWPWLIRELKSEGISTHLAHQLRVKALASQVSEELVYNTTRNNFISHKPILTNSVILKEMILNIPPIHKDLSQR